MASYRVTLPTGIHANLLSILRGTQSGGGIVIAPGVDATLSGFWNTVFIENEGTGTLRIGSDGPTTTMASDGSQGIPLAPPSGPGAPGGSITIPRDRVRVSIGDIVIVSQGAQCIAQVELVA